MLRKMSGLVLFCVSVCGSVWFSVVRIACCPSCDRQWLRFPSQSVSLMSEFAEPARNDPPPTQRHLYTVIRKTLHQYSLCLLGI